MSRSEKTEMQAFSLTPPRLFSLQLVTSEYSKLQGAIDDLGSAIDGTLGRQKEDLQRTHKTEMRKAQVEIESLSKERTRLEESIVTNERACQLETERDWYRKEVSAKGAICMCRIVAEANRKHRTCK